MEPARILIVEDEAIISLHIRKMVEKMGYVAAGVVTSGEEAVERAEEFRPDLVLMDIILSGPMDGVDAARRIRDRLRIPVVYLTAHADIATVKRARESAPFGYVLKPVNAQDLFSTIDTALHRHALEVELAARTTELETANEELQATNEELQSTVESLTAAQEQLAESEVRYRQMIEHMHTAVAIYEAVGGGEDFIIREFNRAAEIIESVERSAIIGRSVLDVFPGIREFGLFDVIRRVWKTGAPEHHPVGFYRDNRIAGWRENYVYRLPGGSVVAVYDDVTEQKRAEVALRESEARYRTMTEVASDYVFRIAIDGEGNHTMDFISDGFTRITGWEPDDVRTLEQWAGIINPEDITDVMENHRRMIATGEMGIVECRSRIRNGTEHVVRISARAERGESGSVTAIIGSVRDITEQRAAEEKLRRSEERYRMIVETASEGILTIDADYSITYVNRHMAKMLGYEPEQIVGRSSFDFIFEEDRERLKALIENRKTGDAAPYEHRYRRRDGSELWAIVSPMPLFGPDGGFAGSFAMFTDITDGKEAARKLQEQNVFLQTLLDIVPSPIFYRDPHGVYTGCNRAFEELVGKRRGDILGKTIYDISSREIADKFKEMDDLLLKNPGVQQYEWRIQNGIGEERDVVFHKASFTSAGRDVAGIVGIISDITGRKRMEGALMGSLSQKEALLREVHHRVKNNLQMIISILEQQAQQIGDECIQNQFQETIGRVRAMSFIHEGLYQSENAASINISEYIEQLSIEVLRGYRGNPGELRVDVQVNGVELPLEQALPLGLLMNE
ncbi:MAG: PAS domain S-box protein, partial [Spirochaetes bacterium]|nr:PAS domain S-box protein [Spirochaetota bacterium]